MKKFYIIDGNAYIHRAYHALPPLTTSTGAQVGALYGFIRMLLKILQKENPDYIAVCFDTPKPTFRHKEFPDYKITRKETDDELKNQLPLARKITEAINITTFEKDGFEADDLIGTLSEEAKKTKGIKTIIVTGDKDVLQLVDENTFVLNEPKDILYDVEKVKERYGVEPEKVTDVLGLAGDSSDNVPGIKGIGEKTAIKLIQEFGSVENLISQADKVKGKISENIKNCREDALLSKKLVTIVRDIPLDKDISNCKRQEFDRENLINLLREFEFHSLINQIVTTSDKKEKTDYKVILTRKELEELAREISKSEIISIDTETTGASPITSQLVGISISIKPYQGWYIPVGHKYLGNPKQLELNEIREELGTVLENEKIKKYGQNIKYDFLVLKRHGIELKGIYFDTMLGSYLLNPSKQNHSLDIIAIDFLGFKMTRIEELIGKGAKQITMDEVEIERVTDYACSDSDIVLRVSKKMEDLLFEKKLDKLFFDVEMPLVTILADMEETGIKVDIEYLKKLSVEFEGNLSSMEKEIFKIAGKSFNINSPKQLQEVLFNELKLKPVRKTKTGFSTDEEVLKILALTHKLPAKILEYREIQKLKSTYIDSLIELVYPKTKRVHTSFNQAVTATGRLSSSEPNMQNIPIRTELGRKIRRAFIPEEGFVFLSADYSQIDLRALAHISKDKKLCEAFREGLDIHTSTASEVFGIQEKDVTNEMRKKAKGVNFGIVYGQKAWGLSMNLGISVDESQKYIDDYFEKYAGVRQWIEETLESARKNGYVTTLLNRRRYLPEINAANKQQSAFAERTAINTPIQGTSADIIKVAMINIYKKLAPTRLKCKMLLQVHDDLLFEVPEDELKEVSKLVKDEMENAVKLAIPLVATIKSGNNWSDVE